MEFIIMAGEVIDLIYTLLMNDVVLLSLQRFYDYT
jgi:hypothetical protein